MQCVDCHGGNFKYYIKINGTIIIRTLFRKESDFILQLPCIVYVF